MLRQSKADLDAAILDRAAALFARHGFEQISVQSIADEVGYSKAGLLHRFPSKEAIQDAVVDSAIAKIQELVASLSNLEAGYERDRQAITSLVDLAQSNPGLTALFIGVLGYNADHGLAERLESVPECLFQMFDPEPCNNDPLRHVRIGAACGGLAIIAVGSADQNNTAELRPLIIRTCLSTLGHHDAPETNTPETKE